MLLTLNVENTHMELGVFDGESLLFTSRMKTDRSRTGDEYAAAFRDILERHGIQTEMLQDGIVCSVVPAFLQEIRHAMIMLLQHQPLVVGPGVKTGLNILMDNPASLGSDLVVSAVAAAAEYPVPLIVAALDTATTLMAVNERKCYVGTVIAPGTDLSMSALSEACDQLPRISIEKPETILGRNTVDSMRSGAVFGSAAMLDGLVVRIEQQIGQKCSVIATGSMAELITPCCSREIILDKTLIHRGLRHIYEKNVRR